VRAIINNSDQFRPGEPERAYEAYCFYRDLGPRRSIAEAWRLYRQTPAKKRSRGRPRKACAADRRPSGQWTAWSSKFQWSERAADYDAQLDAKHRRARMQGIQKRERRRLQMELLLQERLEELVACLEAQLDKLDKLPITTYSVWKREINGKHVAASKTRVQGVNLMDYAKLVRSTNSTARFAIVGVAHKRSHTFNDLPAAAGLRAPGRDPASSTGSIDRLPGESARAYRAYLAYRDQGPQRSLTAAWKADRQKSESATKAGKQGRGTRRAGHWPVWSSRWNWVARAEAYDAILVATQRRAQLRSSEQIEQRRFDFECKNQERLETRSDKIAALHSKTGDAPVTDVTTEVTERRLGKIVLKMKTYVKGLDGAGMAELGAQLQDTLRQAVVGVR
jgi:hypothetical protein